MMQYQVRDTAPRELADGLATLAASLAEQDAEMAAVLREAQARLEAIAWNRYAAHMSAQSTRRAFVRRHRSAQEGASHA